MSSQRTFGITIVIILLAACSGLVHGEDATTQPSGRQRVAVFNLSGALREAPVEIEFGFNWEKPASLHDLLEKFEKAGKDERLKAIVLTFDSPAFGWAQMQEMRQSIHKLRAAGKEVFCYLEQAGPSVYMLATAASRIALTPTGNVQLVGLSSEQTYFKGLLDKLGLAADMICVGDYKGADEPFTRTGPSEQSKEMMDWLIKDLYEQMIEAIADGRHLQPNNVRRLIDRGPFTAREAREAGLIDELVYAEDLTNALRERYGTEIDFVHNYGQDKGPNIDFSNPFSFFSSIGKMMGKSKPKASDTIAVVYIEGVIMTGRTEPSLFGESNSVGSTTLRRVLTKARDDENIKAVVLRVNSPGGSATASDIIWHAASELSETKPLVVSMGNVAASGGYYVSAAGVNIFAEPGTLTGSIGVVGGKLITKGLWDWAGVSFHETNYGKNADLYSANRAFSEEQRATIQRHMQQTYEDFKDRVQQGRGDRLSKDLEDLAGGRVYTGRQAAANGLVDRLGGLREAIEYAAAEAGISKYDIRALPEPKNFLDMLFEGMTEGKEKDSDNLGGDITYRPRFPGWSLPAGQAILSILKQADPLRAQAIRRGLLRIELLNRESVLTVLPTEILIR
ncbi:MAG: signal peptide peptidase SppA [Phycisphaerales bacterium]|nr:signal peptide peptidase SppA [Phycisphaerales bacterium]